jgi:hypothetical protein
MMMQTVDGFHGIAQAALACRSDSRSMVQLSFSGRRRDVKRDLVEPVVEFANALGIMSTVVPDPENRWWRRIYRVTIALNGPSPKFVELGAAMVHRTLDDCAC